MDLFISINKNGDQPEPTTEELEEEYKKSRLDAAKKKEPSASNITDEEGINSKNKTEA